MPLGFSLEELATLPTTSYRFVLVTRLVVITGIVALSAFVAMLLMGKDTIAMDVLNSWFLFLGALAGINVAQYGVKRATDKDTKVAVATAKATGPASVTVRAEDQSKVSVNAPPVTQEHAAPVTVDHPAGPVEEQEWAVGDGKAGLL